MLGLSDGVTAALIGAIFTFVAALLAYVFNHRKTRAEAAHIDPVSARCGEAEQLAAFKTGGVNQNVIQMLPADTLVIGDDDVAGLEAAFTEALDSIANHIA